MQRPFGPPPLATTPAEVTKYTAPLLLLHGRWCTAAVWRPFIGYLCHLGWTCHTLTLFGHRNQVRGGRIVHAGFAERLAAVRAAITACDATPVLIGHDLGGLVAMHCGTRARAVVALAPFIPHPVATTFGAPIGRWRAWLARWRSPLLSAADGPLAVEYEAHRPPGGTTSESARLIDELGRRDLRVRGRATVPTLLVAGQADTVSTPDLVERLATDTGATVFRAEGGGHALPWEPGWEKRVTLVHRWLVQQLGESLLATLEKADEEN